MSHSHACRGWWTVAVLLFAALLTGLDARVAHAQTGLTEEHAREIEQLPQWQPEAMGYAEHFMVDLRGKLPRPGNQSMNNCAAWAFGYAGKTYLEAMDQGWLPDRPARIFSPTYMYNQINEGKDNGSSPLNALKLLAERGCATLATAPYLPRDFKTPPTQRAHDEASLFRIARYYQLTSGPEIRTALQQGHIVIFGVRTNPVFNSGRYDVYNKSLHADGNNKRKPGQAHGFHAMAIVGYNDTKQAFLVMNSWGTQWAQGGYCWLGYDVAEAFNRTGGEQTNFIDWAVVMLDLKEKVDVGPDGKAIARPLDLESVAIDAVSDYRGFDARTKKHQYFFAASLTGQSRAIDEVVRVEWSVDHAGKTHRVTATDRNLAFRVSGLIERDNPTVKGKITYRNGTTRDVSVDVKIPAINADNRPGQLATRNLYWGKRQEGGKQVPMWDWKVWFDANETEYADIAKIVWDLSSVYSSDSTVVWTPDMPGATEQLRVPGSVSAVPPLVKAEIHYKDGGVKKLQTKPVFDDPVNDNIRLESTYREDGRSNGRTWYTWTVQLRMPHRLYYTDVTDANINAGSVNGYTNHYIATHNNYQATGSSSREFEATATFKTKDGKTHTLKHWVTLGPEARYKDPRRIDIDVSDVYEGLSQGAPSWLVTLKPVGDEENLKRITRAVYKLPETYSNPTITVPATADVRGGKLGMEMLAFSRQPVEVTVHYDDETTSTFNVTATTSASANESIALFSSWWDAWGRLMIEPAGPRNTVLNLSSAEYRYRNKGRWYRDVIAPGYHRNRGLLRVSNRVELPVDVVGFLKTADGWTQVAEARMAIKHKEPWGNMPLLSLRGRERFWGYSKEGRPEWIVSLQVVGATSFTDKIQSVTYEGNTRGATTEPFKYVMENNQELALLKSRPVAVRALVTFKPESNLAPMRVYGWLPTTSARTAKPVELASARLSVSATQHRWLVHLTGWEMQLREVESVTYSTAGQDRANQVKVEQRQGNYPEFGFAVGTTGPTRVDALVRFKDGREESLSIVVGQPIPQIDYVTQTRYWGPMSRLAGADARGDAFETTARLVGDIYDMRSVRETTLRFANPFDQVVNVGLPLHTGRRVSAGVGEMEFVDLYMLREKKRLPGRKLTAPEKYHRELTLLFEPGPVPAGGAAAAGSDADKAAPKTAGPAEYIAYLAGPEMDLTNVTYVDYKFDFAGTQREQRVFDRWGEFHEGYEARIVDQGVSGITATVRFNDGTKQTVTWTRPAGPTRQP